MVAGFNRSISFPGSPRLKTRPSSAKSYHARSISLPCRSHPFISQLQDEVQSVKSWQSTNPESESASASSVWLSDGLARLELLHTSLYDFFHLPQTQDSLPHASEWTGQVLDDFLRLADAHGCFRSEIVAMNDHQSDAQVALRRKDSSKLSSCAKNMKKTEKELMKLAASLREVSKTPVSTRSANGVEEAERAGIIREVIQVTVSASTVLIMELAAAAAASATMKKSCWMSSKKRLIEVEEEYRNAMERLQRLEECIGAIERRSEMVLRCLLNTRVALLRIMTPSL